MSPQVILPYNRMFIMGLAIAIVGALMALFFRTRFGLRLRATTDDLLKFQAVQQLPHGPRLTPADDPLLGFMAFEARSL